MKILADENIPFVREAFETLGEVETMSGRAINAGVAHDADLLLVRSVTKLGGLLLEGSHVQFVGTATIGEDHVDKDHLRRRGIAFASAPGSNANSVAEYVVAALLEMARRFSLNLEKMTLGIIGVGAVGSRVHAKASALGMTCVLNDPPLARSIGEPRYRPIEELLDCDILTVHVPLSCEGPDRTFHMVDASFLRRLKPGMMLINTSRGAVAETEALKLALRQGRLKAGVLDVWEGEPSIDAELLERVFIGTPHIAGYSFDGKVNGTLMLYEAACRFLGVESRWDPTPLLPAPPPIGITVDSRSADEQVVLREAVKQSYDIMRDDAAMRALLSAPPDERARLFDRLRKEYPVRREFYSRSVTVTPPNEPLAAKLRGVGFEVVTQ